MKNSSNSRTGLGLIDVVQIVFIILKLLKVISQPWPVVLIPLWISLGVLLIAMAIIGSVACLINKNLTFS